MGLALSSNLRKATILWLSSLLLQGSASHQQQYEEMYSSKTAGLTLVLSMMVKNLYINIVCPLRPQ